MGECTRGVGGGSVKSRRISTVKSGAQQQSPESSWHLCPNNAPHPSETCGSGLCLLPHHSFLKLVATGPVWRLVGLYI